ncbi:hypothetical protein DID88_009737 [Monilinia fructigena]|uniref:WAC domain-containing protein n=1 Tax=Monilinia fructigena TaxID=38457 RepID=A0A395IK57_9HELO|nr:hypothetical protein DID88_009737 [Monilinia fructigena]
MFVLLFQIHFFFLLLSTLTTRNNQQISSTNNSSHLFYEFVGFLQHVPRPLDASRAISDILYAKIFRFSSRGSREQYVAKPDIENEDTEVWLIPATGEYFLDYEQYLARMDFYKQVRNSPNNSYLALKSELTGAQEVEEAFPNALKAPILRRVTISNYLSNRYLGDLIFDEFKSDYYPGEVVTVHVVTGDRLTVFDGRPNEEAVVDDAHITRDRKIFTKQVLRSFIKKTVTREAWTGAPCFHGGNGPQARLPELKPAPKSHKSKQQQSQLAKTNGPPQQVGPHFQNFHNSTFAFAPLASLPPAPPPPPPIKYPIDDLDVAPRVDGPKRPDIKYFSQDNPMIVGRPKTEDCELFVEIHCAVLKILVNSEADDGKIQVQLPEIEDSDDEEESDNEASAVPTPTPEPEPKPRGRATRSSLAKAEAEALQRAAEQPPEEPNDERHFDACEALLVQLAPLDLEPTQETARLQYAKLDVNLRIKALQIISPPVEKVAEKEASASVNGDVNMHDVEEEVQDSHGDEIMDSDEEAPPTRSLRRGLDRAAERKRKLPKQSKALTKVIKDIQKLQDKVKECEEEIAILDNDLREADCPRTRVLGKDRFWNRYYGLNVMVCHMVAYLQVLRLMLDMPMAAFGFKGPDDLEREGYIEMKPEWQDEYRFKFNMTVPERKVMEEGNTHVFNAHQWGYYDDAESVEGLLNWLDSRGNNELKLRKELQLYKEKIITHMEKRKEYLNPSDEKSIDPSHKRMSTRGKQQPHIDHTAHRCLSWRNNTAIKELGHLHSDQPRNRKATKKSAPILPPAIEEERQTRSEAAKKQRKR